MCNNADGLLLPTRYSCLSIVLLVQIPLLLLYGQTVGKHCPSWYNVRRSLRERERERERERRPMPEFAFVHKSLFTKHKKISLLALCLMELNS
jgi:hypothetical protein